MNLAGLLGDLLFISVFKLCSTKDMFKFWVVVLHRKWTVVPSSLSSHTCHKDERFTHYTRAAGSGVFEEVLETCWMVKSLKIGKKYFSFV
jgi:hypothetical protein